MDWIIYLVGYAVIGFVNSAILMSMFKRTTEIGRMLLEQGRHGALNYYISRGQIAPAQGGCFVFVWNVLAWPLSIWSIPFTAKRIGFLNAVVLNPEITAELEEER